MLEMNLKNEFMRITGKDKLEDFGLKNAEIGKYFIFKVIKKEDDSVVLGFEELGGNTNETNRQ